MLAFNLKVAVTERGAVIDRLHVAVPVQAPLHPTKYESEAGIASSDTFEPLGKFAPQVEPQLIARGALKTLPVPPPVFRTFTEYAEPSLGDTGKVCATCGAAV
jgi:hypothetical protein